MLATCTGVRILGGSLCCTIDVPWRVADKEVVVRRLAVLFAVVVLLALPGEAGAAGAIPIGTGVDPNVALDGAGTAYIAWNGDEVSNSTIRFCKLPRGAAACSVATTITDTAHNSLSRPFLFVSGATVRVVQYRYGADPGLFEFSSANGGGTFGAARKVGTAVFDDAVVGPGNTMSGVTNAITGGTFFQNVPIDGTSPTQTTQANLSADHPYAGAIALLGNLPFVVYDDGSALAQFRRYDGTGPVNDAVNWTAAVDIGYADSPSLASGPLGLFMLSGTQTDAMTVRRFDGATFAPPGRCCRPARTSRAGSRRIRRAGCTPSSRRERRMGSTSSTRRPTTAPFGARERCSCRPTAASAASAPRWPPTTSA